jgi:hypothetical protein
LASTPRFVATAAGGAARASREWLTFWLSLARNRFNGASRVRRCAVLIDGDSAPSTVADDLFCYVTHIGRVASAGMYANFASASSASWAPAIRKYGVTAFQHYNTSAGRNGADIALAVAAMDHLHTSRIDEFFIMSSDSDLSALAHRIRQSGARVHGVGSAQAAKAFRESCDSFLTFEEIGVLANADAGSSRSPNGDKPLTPRAAEDRVLLALVSLGGARHWVDMQRLGNQLSRSHPPFDPRLYSRRTLTELCDATDSIEVDRSAGAPRARVALGVRNGSVPGETSRS